MNATLSSVLVYKSSVNNSKNDAVLTKVSDKSPDKDFFFTFFPVFLSFLYCIYLND